jgi:AcrR family transcriptional regulator|uniref:TetR/AcrR family transcriptional regulator n=1 Tax=Desulfobacca acetoxidans TaxID=60893 RepID=A0A7V6DQZ2_9BACT
MKDGKVTKARISRAALKLFVEKGVAETTVRDIAAAAQVAEGTLYRHFTGKDELAWELFAVHFTALAGELERRQGAKESLAGKLAAMVEHFCTFFDQDPVLFSYLLLTQHDFLKRVSPDMSNPVEVVQQVIRRAMAKGELPPGDAAVAAAMVLGMVLQSAVFKIYGRITTNLTSLSDRLSRACLRVLNGQD